MRRATFLIAALVTLAGLQGTAYAAKPDQLPEPQCVVAALPNATATCAVADLDGDSIPDHVIAELVLYPSHTIRVEVRLSTLAATRSFSLSTTSSTVGISARDVDGDHDVDLVFFHPLISRPIELWTNDGSGSFVQQDLARYPDLQRTSDSELRQIVPQWRLEAVPWSRSCSCLSPGRQSSCLPPVKSAALLRWDFLPVPRQEYPSWQRIRAPAL